MNSDSILIMRGLTIKSNTPISLINVSNEIIFNLSISINPNGNLIRNNLFWEKIFSYDKVTFGITWMEMNAKNNASGYLQWYDVHGFIYTKPINITL